MGKQGKAYLEVFVQALNRLRPNIIDFGFNRASPREIVFVKPVDLTPVKWSKNLTPVK